MDSINNLDKLSFKTLRSANSERYKSDKYARCQNEWNHANWMLALVGEVGELANILKKVDRGDFDLNSVRKDISDELADIQTYLDLLAMVLGVDLGNATREKFNDVSERIGSPVVINCYDQWYLEKQDEF